MLSVLFATHNGSQTLQTVLSAYCKIEPIGEDWKLIIVNNASNDDSVEIIRSFKDDLPIEVLSELKKGKNIALNTGLSRVGDGLVVLTDDDVIPHPDWLKNLKAAANAHPDYSIFGGPILPEWEQLPEEWILKWVKMEAVFAILDIKREDGPIAHHSIFGPNMAVRSQVFDRGYRFDETIGPQGANYSMGSETELLLRLEKDGFKAWFCGNAIVKHMIRANQLNKEWILKRAIRFGRGQFRLGRVYQERKLRILGVPLQCLVQIIKRFGLYCKAVLTNRAEKVFKERWSLNYYYGIALEANALSKNSNRSNKCFRK